MGESTNLRCCKDSFSFYIVSLESGSTCTENYNSIGSAFGFPVKHDEIFE